MFEKWLRWHFCNLAILLSATIHESAYIGLHTAPVILQSQAVIIKESFFIKQQPRVQSCYTWQQLSKYWSIAHWVKRKGHSLLARNSKKRFANRERERERRSIASRVLWKIAPSDSETYFKQCFLRLHEISPGNLSELVLMLYYSLSSSVEEVPQWGPLEPSQFIRPVSRGSLCWLDF